MSTKQLVKSEKAEIAFKLTQELIESLKQGAIAFLFAGKNLDKLQREKLWEHYASHLTSFDDYLKEVGIERQKGYNYMRIWREFGELIIKNKLNVEYTRLAKLLPVAKGKPEEEKMKWLTNARELTLEGFDNEIKEAKGKTPTDKCDHPLESRRYGVRCGVCSKWLSGDLGEEDILKLLKK